MDETETGSGQRMAGLWGAAMVVLLVGSYLIFRSGSATITGQEPSASRAWFIVTNALTLSGFELTTSISEYERPGKVTIFMLIAAGALMSLIVGGWALTRILNMPYSDGQIVRAALFEFLLVLLGGAVLMGPAGPGRAHLDFWEAMFQATSALANAGQVLGSPLGWNDPRTHLVLLPLALIGGLGVPVLLDISSALRLGHGLHSHSRLVLALAGGVYLIGTVAIAAVEMSESVPGKTAAILGSTESLNSRSLGMTFGTFQMLAPASQWIVMLLMLIGGSPGGTAGGLKTTTLFVLARDSVRLWRGEQVGRLFGLAVLWTMVYALAILITTIALVMIQPHMPGERMLFLTISAITNTGTSHAPLSLPSTAVYALSIAMLFGRFAPLLVLWYAVRCTMRREG